MYTRYVLLIVNNIKKERAHAYSFSLAKDQEYYMCPFTRATDYIVYYTL